MDIEIARALIQELVDDSPMEPPYSCKSKNVEKSGKNP